MSRIVAFLSVFMFLLLVAAPALSGVGMNINWGAFTQPVLDNMGKALGNSCLVQLILDADGDGIDGPGANGEPSGGDRLLDTSHIREGSFFPGRFSHNVTVPEDALGRHVYVRAWDADEVKEAMHYGDTRVFQPSTWLIDNAVRLTLDATESGSFGTSILWLPNAIPVGKLARFYAIKLDQNCPNPFKNTTAIGYCVAGRRSYEMIEGGERLADYEGTDLNRIDVSIHDVSGRLVRELISANRLPGYHRITWDGTDGLGRRIPSGSYLCRLVATGPDGSTSTVTKRMVLLR